MTTNNEIFTAIFSSSNLVSDHQRAILALWANGVAKAEIVSWVKAVVCVGDTTDAAKCIVSDVLNGATRLRAGQLAMQGWRP